MINIRSLRMVLLGLLLVLTVALVDSVLDSDGDQVVVMGMAWVLTLVIAIGAVGSRPLLPIRGDLARWLQQHADTSGEQIGTVADRAVSDYRRRLTEGAPR